MIKEILFVYASPRGRNSLSRGLAEHFERQARRLGYNGKVIRRDLAADPPPFVSDAWIRAAFTDAAARSEADRKILDQSDTYLSELASADLIVLATPMHNYGMPALLKAWIDQVVRIGETFSFDLARGDFPLEPIFAGKRMLVLSSRGEFGFQGGIRTDWNHLDPHIATVARYLGVDRDNIRTVAVEFQEFKDERHQESLACARREIERLAGEFFSTESVRPAFAETPR